MAGCWPVKRINGHKEHEMPIIRKSLNTFPHTYMVVVGNVGTVYVGPNPIEARREYGEMKRASLAPFGRASGESVTLFMDGEPLKGFEHHGTNQED